jgi:stage II sporulation protein E
MTKKLYDGDYIMMMSDGVLDTVPEWERAEFLQQIIGDDPGQNPQVIAGRILNASLLLQNFEAKDDMTVLVTGIWEK